MEKNVSFPKYKFPVEIRENYLGRYKNYFHFFLIHLTIYVAQGKGRVK